jgi:hypothetical protein
MRDEVTGNWRKLHDEILQIGGAFSMYRRKRNAQRV